MQNRRSPKPIRTVTNVEESLRPLHWLNSILGLSVFEIPQGYPWPKMSILYSLTRSIIYGSLAWHVILLNSNEGKYALDFIGILRIVAYTNMFIAAISTVLSFKCYKRIKCFWKRITLADETLEMFGIDPDYKLAYRENMRTVIVWCSGGVFIFLANIFILNFIMNDIWKVILRTTVFQLPLLVNPIIELNFTIKISILGKRFERLNTLIQSVATSPLQTVESMNLNKYQDVLKKSQNGIVVKSHHQLKNKNNIELLLKTSRQLHLDLCATARNVNDTCSIQMSMQMAASFLLLTGFSYCFYLVYKDPVLVFSLKIYYYVAFGVYIIATVIRLIMVVRTSVNVTTEAQKTSQIAHEIQLSRWQKKLIDEVHQLSLQIMQHPLYFTASGLMVLDFCYVRGLLGSVTTYLMILIQNQPDMIKVAETLASLDNTTTSPSST